MLGTRPSLWSWLIPNLYWAGTPLDTVFALRPISGLFLIIQVWKFRVNFRWCQLSWCILSTIPMLGQCQHSNIDVLPTALTLTKRWSNDWSVSWIKTHHLHSLLKGFLIPIALEKKPCSMGRFNNHVHVARCKSVGVASRRLGFRILTTTDQSGRKRSNRQSWKQQVWRSCYVGPRRWSEERKSQPHRTWSK